MQYCLDNNLNNVLILEDDYWIEDEVSSVNTRLEEIFKIENWDVIMLDWFLNGVLKRTKYFNDNLRTRNHKKYGFVLTSAYAVNKHFFKKLRNTFKESYDRFSDIYNHKLHRKYACDNYWIKIQKDNWFIIYPKIGLQSKNLYSDIAFNRN